MSYRYKVPQMEKKLLSIFSFLKDFLRFFTDPDTMKILLISVTYVLIEILILKFIWILYCFVFGARNEESETVTVFPYRSTRSEVQEHRFLVAGIDCTDYLRWDALEGKGNYIASFLIHGQYVKVEYLTVPENICLGVKMIQFIN
jgi:hypothetical protein